MTLETFMLGNNIAIKIMGLTNVSMIGEKADINNEKCKSKVYT